MDIENNFNSEEYIEIDNEEEIGEDKLSYIITHTYNHNI